MNNLATAPAGRKPSNTAPVNEHDALLLAIGLVARIILTPPAEVHGNELADIARALQLAADTPPPKQPLLVLRRCHRLWLPERGSAPRGRPLLHHGTRSPHVVPAVGDDDVEFVSINEALHFDYQCRSRGALRDALVRETSRRVFASPYTDAKRAHRQKVGGLLAIAFVHES